MPPARKFVRQIKVNLGHMDLAFLEFITRSSESTMGDELRAALHENRQRRMLMISDRFSRYVKETYLPDLASDEDRDAAEADYDTLFRIPMDDSLAKMFQTLPKLEPRGEGLASSAAMFDEED